MAGEGRPLPTNVPAAAAANTGVTPGELPTPRLASDAAWACNQNANGAHESVHDANCQGSGLET